MLYLKRIIAIAIIATFLASIPLVCADYKSDVVQTVFELKVGSNHFAKPGGGGGGKPDYKIIYRGFTTVTPAAITIYTANSEDLSADFVRNTITTSAGTWDLETSKDLLGAVTTTGSTGSLVYNYKNEIMFGTYSNNNVIAVTYIWSSRLTKQIVEFDILFNSYYVWGDASVDSSKMDLQNIATHELGHAFNLDDIYDSSKSALTMYGYSWEGDIAKRTLEPGDIAGIRAVFGA